MDVKVIGVYPVEAPEPVHLVELRFTNCACPVDVVEITQENPEQPKSNWQVPWDEKNVGRDGNIALDSFDASPNAGEVRLVFFFHYLDLDKPLLTPAGPVRLPVPTEKPNRFRFMVYECPC